MHLPTSTTTILLFTATLATALPSTLLSPRQAAGQPCFIIGKTALPAEVATVATTLGPTIKCSTTAKTLSNVPDLTSGAVSFSSIDFTKSTLSPLAFALQEFATSTPLVSTDLKKFQDSLDVYTATEAGIRSVAGNVASIKVPKFFLSMQVSRILTAQGKAPTAAGLQVDHLRDKVTKNAPKESKALLDEVARLATVLA